MTDPSPTDEDRYPLLTGRGRETLRFLREHPAAPIYRNQSGNRLNAADLQEVLAFEREVATHSPDWRPGCKPPWLDAFVSSCLSDVPHYRRYGIEHAAFEKLPTISRADLSRDIAAFVPDKQPLDRLINFSTSGTTGHPLVIPSHPTVAAGSMSTSISSSTWSAFVRCWRAHGR